MDNEETQTIKVEHLDNANSLLRNNIDELDPTQIDSREKLMAIFAANGNSLKTIIINAGKNTETGRYVLSLNNTEAVYDPQKGNTTITVNESSDQEGKKLNFQIVIPLQTRYIGGAAIHLAERDEEGHFIPGSGIRLDKEITSEQAGKYAKRYKQAVSNILDGLDITNLHY